MKITYTGRQVELAPAQLKKLEAQFGKIGKLLDGRRECEAHVILSLERHLHHAEATVNYYGHPLVGLWRTFAVPPLRSSLHRLFSELFRGGMNGCEDSNEVAGQQTYAKG